MDSEVLKKIKALSRSKKLVSKKELFSLCNQTVELLKNEIKPYRKSISIADDIPGGLVDFSNCQETDVIIVPDLHARKELIYRLLSYELNDGKTVYERLASDSMKIIFLGDILHSELSQKERWLLAFAEWEKGNPVSDAMSQEMCDGLSVMEQIMVLKNAFPGAVHCLKGNHENIRNECDNGNRSFHKIVMEGEMVLDFMLGKYGQKVVDAIAAFELSLPVAAIFNNIIVSHAEPAKAFSKNEIIDSVIDTDVVFDLTWTKNGDVEENTAEKMFHMNCKKNKHKKFYITGHRPVKGRFNLRQDGSVVQIHNPNKMQFALVRSDKDFDPESDIIELK